MMTYKREGQKVTIEMTVDDYTDLTLMLGVAVGLAMRDADMEAFYRRLDFVNRLNATNPDFRPYEIPAEFRKEA